MHYDTMNEDYNVQFVVLLNCAGLRDLRDVPNISSVPFLGIRVENLSTINISQDNLICLHNGILKENNWLNKFQ